MKPPISGALEKIEAALRAALSVQPHARRDRARRALHDDAAGDAHLEAWLESVAAELESGSGVQVPDDMVETIAARMRTSRGQSLAAHGRLDAGTARNLIR